MDREELKKIMKYRPPLLVSLLVIVGFFLMFMYMSKNMDSYAISEVDNTLSDSFEVNAVSLGIASDKDIRVSRVYDNDKQLFSFDIKNSYGNYYVKDKRIEDDGLIYIISNSYPNKDLKDSNGNSLNIDYQTWITQVSIWLYLNNKNTILTDDEINSIMTSKKIFVDNNVFGSDKTIYEEYIKSLVNNALVYKNIDKKISAFSDGEIYMTKDKKYYQSSAISVNSNDSENFKRYFVKLDNSVEGSFIVDENGKKIKEGSEFKVTDKFYLRVPRNKVTINNTTVKIDIVGVYDEIEAFSYKCDGFSDVISSRKFDKNIDTSLYIKF